MHKLDERVRVGLDYLEAVTTLLQRIRTAHPTAGLYDAAEPQWWWAQTVRPTDEFGQLFWFDDDGLPAAAVIATAFGDEIQLAAITLPDATPEVVGYVMRRGLQHASEGGFEAVTIEVDQRDDARREVLDEYGFTNDEGGIVESWLDASSRTAVTTLADGYQLLARGRAGDRPHHMINARRKHADPEQRLRQTSLYRADLDLAVYGPEGDVAAYGLFWFDPETAVGVVEPMRTEDEHQRRGLARHVLTAGIDRLARAGARRIKICFEPDNPASGHLYQSVGFVPDRANDLLAGPTTPPEGLRVSD